MVNSWGSNSHFLLIETAEGERTIRQDRRGRVQRARHVSHPLALPCSSGCATGFLNAPHSQPQSGGPSSPRMNLGPSTLPLLLLTSLLNFCEEPRRTSSIAPVDRRILICVFLYFFTGQLGRGRACTYFISRSHFSAADRPSLVLQFLLDAFYEERYFYFAQLFWAESGHCVVPCLTLSNLQRFADALFSWPQWFSVSFLSSMSLNELASFNAPAMRHEFEMKRYHVLSCWTTCLYWQHCDASPSQIEACGHSARVGV